MTSDKVPAARRSPRPRARRVRRVRGHRGGAVGEARLRQAALVLLARRDTAEIQPKYSRDTAEIQSRGVRFMSPTPARAASYKLHITSYTLQVTHYKLHITSYTLQVASNR